MKTALIAISTASLVLFSASCRTSVPINPHTGMQDPSLIPPNNKGTCGLGVLCRCESKCSDSKGEVKPSK